MMSNRVIIVGGGIAGIAAAARLIENGITNITILEAENRLGGRVHTVPFGETCVDLGAHWVHGEKGNRVFEMADPMGLVEPSRDIENIYFALSDGSSIPTDVGLRLFERCAMALDDETSLKDFQGSVGNYLKSRYCELVDDLGFTPEQRDAFFGWVSRFECSIEGCDNLEEASASGLSHYKQCEGDPILCWKRGGYSTIIDVLLKKLPNSKGPEIDLTEKTLLGKEVVEIDWMSEDGVFDENGGVKIKCSDGSEYKGAHALVTVSLGVLKQCHTTMFKPDLPPYKIDAIRGLDIGVVNKIYLYYSTQWWPEECSGFSLLYTSKYTNEATDAPDWANEVIGFYSERNSPKVLCGWLIGEAARNVESYDDAVVKKTCTDLLRKFLGRSFNVPVPDNIVRSKWFSNPHFRGSYSFRSMRTEEMGTSAAALAQPLVNDKGKQVVLFAGEATHDHFYSTVHGAVETGWKEADRIIGLYTNLRKKKKIVIVGAGLAGLTAASMLLKAGLTHVTLLEAQPVAGGRISSLTLEGGGGSYIELGAQWLHGSHNLLYTLAKENGLLSSEYSDEGQGIYYREGGEKIPLSLVHEVSGVVGDILSECEKFCSDNSIEEPPSVGYYLDTEFKKYLARSDDPPHIVAIKEELYQWHVRFQVIDNSCSDLHKLSAKAWGRYQFCGGQDYVNFKRGFASLIDLLVAGLPQGVLRLGSPVERVVWKPTMEDFLTSPCTVFCKNGTQYKADHVMVTSSIGFLKNSPDFFDPPLPQEYYKGLDSLGFDIINKVFLVYDKPWWNPDTKGIQLVWPSCNSQIPEEMSWTKGLSGFDNLVNVPNVLLGWVGGMEASRMEDIPAEEVGRHCTHVLRLFTANQDIPKPAQVFRSQWGKNKYICGGYSHVKREVQSERVDPTEALSRPVYSAFPKHGFKHPSIILAGEAIHRSHYSTTHGAYESGKTQAEMLLDYILHDN